MAKWGTYPPDEQLRLKRAAAEELYRFAESSPCYCEDGDDQFCLRCVVLAEAKGEE